MVVWSTYFYHYRKHFPCFMKHLRLSFHEALLKLWLQRIYSDRVMKHLLWQHYEGIILYFDHFINHLWYFNDEAFTLTTLWSTYFDHFIKNFGTLTMKHLLWPLQEVLTLTALWSIYFDHFIKHFWYADHEALTLTTSWST